MGPLSGRGRQGSERRGEVEAYPAAGRPETCTDPLPLSEGQRSAPIAGCRGVRGGVLAEDSPGSRLRRPPHGPAAGRGRVPAGTASRCLDCEHLRCRRVRPATVR